MFHHGACTLRLSIRRLFSSQRRRFGARKKRGFQLDALPFTVSPNEAHDKFQKWAVDKQGLGPLLSVGTVNITAAYAPFWYFDLNIRFIAPGPYPRSTAIPQPFRSAYTNAPNGVIHIPGLAAYAGFSYRRSLMDPVHNTTPVFLKKNVVPFDQWMLKPLKYDGQTLEIYPDPWNATRERAFAVIYDELYDMANDQYHEQNKPDDATSEVRVETERLSSRRIYMPTYIVEYTILGITYRACISGCDPSIQVSGVSHKSIFHIGSKGDQVLEGASSFLSHRVVPMAATALQFFGLRPFVGIAQFGLTVISRIAMKLHIVGLFGGALIVWRKLVRPHMDNRAATAEWERQRVHEAQKSESFSDNSFLDNGSAKMYFTRNQERIVQSLSGEEGRYEEEDNKEWYNQWESWAREQWEKSQREAYRAQEEWQRQQQQQQQQGGNYKQYQQQQQQQQQKQSKYQKTKKDDYKWDFDVNDPFSVLSISRNSPKDEVSKAFRREMLKHHPDLQSQKSEKQKQRANERSKIISDAYRKIKSSYKK